MNIIGITGQAKSGKTYIAKELARLAFEVGQIPSLVSFAGPIKRAAEDNGFPKDTHPKEYREFCQKLGAEKRANDPEHWVKLTEKTIQNLAKEEFESLNRGDKYWERTVIIDDVRYQNEINSLLRMDSCLIHVFAGDRLPTPYAKFRKHESEKLAKAIDRTKGKGKKFESFYSQIPNPFNEPKEHRLVWFDNTGTDDECEKLLNALSPLLLGTHLLSSKDAGEIEVRTLSEEERQALLEELEATLDYLWGLEEEDDDDEETE